MMPVESDSRPLSILMPAYNAASHIESVFARIPTALWADIRNVWIINDGSTDRTNEITGILKKRHPLVRTVSFSKNQGYGDAVREGLRRCRDDGCAFAVCLHADGQYPPESIAGFMRYMHQHRIDILQGSRHADGEARTGGMPRYKVIAGKVLTRMENSVFNLAMTDYHSGFIMYSRRALGGIPFEQLSHSFDFDVEMIASARARGFRVAELAIPTRYADEVSHLNPVTYGLRLLRVMVRYRLGYYGP